MLNPIRKLNGQKLTTILRLSSRKYTGTSQGSKNVESLESDQPAGFWPPGPPSFHRDPAVVDEANRLYTDTLRHYKSLGAKSRQEWADPWARREEWRYHPYFSGANVLKNAFPGLSWAVVAFGVYCGYETLSNRAETV